MPKMGSESFTAGDQSWLGSTHGIWNGRTETINVSAFTAGTHYPDGFLPSGTPVALVAGLLVPYDKLEATTTGAGILAGFILTATDINATAFGTGSANVGVPLLDHGRVKSARVPHAFVAPVAAAKRAATMFVYV